MGTLNSVSSHLLSLHGTRTSKIRSSSHSTNRSSFISLSKSKSQRSSMVLGNLLAWSNINRRNNFMRSVNAGQGNNEAEASAATPGHSSGNPWYKWLIGIIMSLVLPFAPSRWSRLLAIKNRVDTVVNTVETAAETVVKVAEGVFHVADEVAQQLPEGGKIQNIVCNVANVAKETAKDAQLVDLFIEKVEDAEKEVVSTFIHEVNETSTEIKDDEVTKDNIQTEKKVEEKPEIAMEIEVLKDENIDDDQPK